MKSSKRLKNLSACTLSLVAALMVGCATMAPQRDVLLSSSFDAEYAKAAMAPGDGKITGSAFMRQNGGGVVTCAGEEVVLLPATLYATERMQILYNNPEGGAKSFYVGRVNFIPDYPAYTEIRRKTLCDAQGGFEFDRVKEGAYYVATQVKWSVGHTLQGGVMSKRVEIGLGENKKIVISP